MVFVDEACKVYRSIGFIAVKTHPQSPSKRGNVKKKTEILQRLALEYSCFQRYSLINVTLTAPKLEAFRLPIVTVGMENRASMEELMFTFFVAVKAEHLAQLEVAAHRERSKVATVLVVELGRGMNNSSLLTMRLSEGTDLDV